MARNHLDQPRPPVVCGASSAVFDSQARPDGEPKRSGRAFTLCQCGYWPVRPCSIAKRIAPVRFDTSALE
jgi:hypothetical protein